MLCGPRSRPALPGGPAEELARALGRRGGGARGAQERRGSGLRGCGEGAGAQGRSGSGQGGCGGVAGGAGAERLQAAQRGHAGGAGEERPRAARRGGREAGVSGERPHCARPCLRGSQGRRRRPGVSESAFLAPPHLSQKGLLVQTERVIRLAKAADISLGPKLLPGRELQGRSIAGPSGLAESPVPRSSSFLQKRGQEGLRAEWADQVEGASSSHTGSAGFPGPSMTLLEAQMIGALSGRGE